MGWKKLLKDAKGKIDEYAEKKQFEKVERERVLAEKEEIRRNYENEVNELLSKFEIKDLRNLLLRVLNVDLKEVWIEYERGGGGYHRKPERVDFTNKIWNYLYEGSLHKEQIIDFALKDKIVAPSFFGNEDIQVGNQRDFENIINAIKVGFQPEKIRDEEGLEAQLTIFIKAKFPELKVERQVISKTGERLDIVIDDNYVFELKVPKSRDTLRNLSAQIEEYSESYPNLCTVIADISEEVNMTEDDGTILEARLTENIREYADKYKRKYDVDSIIVNVGLRKN
tara:strand:+ start:484 stop:1332 length:849 start_codon:yes stop_codon:yes gene_type:complete